MFGKKKIASPEKITPRALKTALNPDVVREFGSEAQSPRVADAIIEEEASAYLLAANDGTKDTKGLVSGFESLIKMELIRTQTVKNRIGTLSAQLSAGQLDTFLQKADNQVSHARFGAVDGDDDLTRAAKWVCGSSNTLKGKGAEAVRQIIQGEVALDRPLSIDRVDHLWRAATPNPEKTVRHINGNPGVNLLCDKLGHVKMENAITIKLAVADSMGKALYLMAAIIRAHGYPDGNGRIARVVYAISLLRSLGPLPAAPAKTSWVQEGHGRYKKVAQGGPAAPSRFVAPTPECTNGLVVM